ncbi:NAD(+)/NADH kinase [Microbacterium sp. kSW2-24]|uniref:diacylglycerol kinase family protein n=1 Tax=Microbacterium galbinum TaxID=2851646 RepID=UPI001FFC4549|nr:diacylglycerol kinase family protein [Microbacterium galbinum]MCK2022684.1 NAD(+)/NADH kinase [Microbacterium galbinum]
MPTKTGGQAQISTNAPRRRRAELIFFLCSLGLYCAWTSAVVAGATTDLDRLIPTPMIPPRSTPGQAVEAFALITHPYAVLAITIVAAVGSWRQRQRRLSTALTVAAAGLAIWDIQRALISRPHPISTFEDSVSSWGYSYPAGHIVGATVLTWVLVTLANAGRKSARSRRKRWALGVMFMILVTMSVWAMGTGRLSDLIGGFLLGVSIATSALWLSGVEDLGRMWRLRNLPVHTGGRAAVIYNPAKILDIDLFRRRVLFALARSGWEPPLWIETRQDDPGRAMARYAISEGVDRVLVAGGDGTARTVCAELASTSIPVALIPAGTGNLLGRNLGISLDEDEALEVALHGQRRAIDMVRWAVDGRATPFAVMAGVGLDAQIMRDTKASLKKWIKAGAYVLAAAQQRRMRPFSATVSVDGKQIYRGSSVMVLLGNVGRLQGGLSLIPAAEPDDGEIHVLIASSGSGFKGLVRLLLSARRASSPNATLQRARGQHVEVVLDRPVPYQLDGDVEGLASAFTARVVPGALVVMTPQRG